MSRELFPQWAALSDDDFATTLVSSLLDVAEQRAAFIDGRIIVDWSAELTGSSQIGARTASRLSERFGSDHGSDLGVTNAPRGRLSFELVTPLGAPRWWVDTLRRAPVVRSVAFRNRGRAACRGWDWPLDVATFGKRGAWLDRAPYGFLRRNATLHSSTLVELLCLPVGLEDALALDLPDLLPPVHTVVVLGQSRSQQGELPMLDAIRSRWRADAAVALELHDEKDWTACVGALTEHLSHDEPLDVALFEALAGAGRAPLCLGRPGAFAAARLSSHSRSVLPKAARRAVPDAAELLQAVERSPEAEFSREIHGASRLAKVAEALAEAPEAREPRLVHANLFRDGERVVRARLGGRHELRVQINPLDPYGLAADAPLTEPPDWVEGETHQLQVVLQDLTTRKEDRQRPAFRALTLPPTGPSSVARFELVIPPDVPEFRARLAIVEPPARILQTLEYRVLVTASAATDGASMWLRVETSPRDLDLLDGARSAVPISFIVNEDSRAEHLITAIKSGEALTVPLASFENLVSNLAKALDAFADGQKAGGIGEGESLKLLRKVADKGVQLREALVAQWGASSLSTAKRIQLVSADVNMMLPLEVCYDGPAPSQKARLCRRAKTLLKRGATRCTCKPSPGVVCPLRFWGLSRIVERHGPIPEVAKALDNSKTGAIADRAGPGHVVDVGGPVLWVMDAIVDSGGDGDTLDVRQKLSTRLKGRLKKDLVEADTWKQWRQSVKQGPRIIAAVVHHGDDELVLDDESLGLGQVDQSLVGSASPIVVLLGCRTQAGGGSSFQPAFRFKIANVPVVVATQSLVIGQFAARCAQEVVMGLRAQRGRRAIPLGDFLRATRGRLLAKGLTVALSIVALGDADYLVGKET